MTTTITKQASTLRETSTKLDDIRSINLRHEAEQMTAHFIEWEYARYTVDGQPQWVDVLYAPKLGGARIAWGADEVWTDARSLHDGIERYFKIDEKEMV
jgi:hypothetical protein